MREHAVQTDQARRHARPAPVRAVARPAAFLALAAAIGNRAAAQVARAESGAGGAGPAPAATQDQGAEGAPGVPGFDAAGASDEQRLDEIRARLGTGDPVRDIWRAFADLPETANAHPDLWGPSAKRHPELARDEEVEAELKARVEQLAREGLAASHAAVDAEIQTLGVEHQFSPDADPDHLGAVAKLQQQAALLKDALRAKNALLQVPVGWEQPPAPDDPAKLPQQGPKQLLFDPGNPPPQDDTAAPRPGPRRGERGAGRRRAAGTAVLAEGIARGARLAFPVDRAAALVAGLVEGAPAAAAAGPDRLGRGRLRPAPLHP